MAFAQFYYDPAVEFENLLDEHAFSPAQGADIPQETPGLRSGGIQPEKPSTEIPCVLLFFLYMRNNGLTVSHPNCRRSGSSSTLRSVNGPTRVGALADRFAELVRRRN